MAGFGQTFEPRSMDWTGPIQNYDPFATWRQSADARSLYANTTRSKLAHNALMEAQARQAEADNHLLSTASPDELNNVFGEPRNEREARIQQIIQGDINAKERGVALIPSWKTMQEYRHGNLANQQLENQIATGELNRQLMPKEFQLKTDTFANTKAYQQTEAEHRKALEAQAQKNLNAQIERDKSAQARVLTQQDFQNQRAINSEFQNMQKSVASGEMSAEDLIQALPGLTPAQQEVLRAHDRMAQGNAAQAQKAADYWNQQMKNREPKPEAGVSVPWYKKGKSTSDYNPSAKEISDAHAAVQQEFERNAQARKQAYFDVNTGKYVPLVRAPAAVPSDGRYDPVPPWLRDPITGAIPGTEQAAMSPFPGQAPAIDYGQDYGGAYTNSASAKYRETIPVPSNRRSQYQDGRVYVVNGQNYRYENGMMVR